MFDLEKDARRLLTLLRRVALVATPLASIGLTSCGCPGPADEVFLIRNPDAQTQALIDACRDPARHDCEPLCRHMIVGQYDAKNDLLHCELHDDHDGYAQVHVGLREICVGGRRPQRLALSAPRRTGSAAGGFFARLFQLEAASVPAFETLRAELAAEGAPAALVDGAASAARDEVRHARLTAALARRYGVCPVLPVVAPTPRRDLGAMAEENAAEGCVREAFGALVAVVQARQTRDPIVAAVMEGIAADEARHAALAAAVDRWAGGRLAPRERVRVAAAREAAVAEVEAQAAGGWTPELGADAGLPGPDATRALLGALGSTPWA